MRGSATVTVASGTTKCAGQVTKTSISFFASISWRLSHLLSNFIIVIGEAVRCRLPAQASRQAMEGAVFARQGEVRSAVLSDIYRMGYLLSCFSSTRYSAFVALCRLLRLRGGVWEYTVS